MATRGVDAGPDSAASPRLTGLGGIYFGWYNIGFAVICLMLGVGSTSYSFGLFVKPVSEDLGLSRATVNLGLIFFHFGSLVFNPILGAMYDRFALKPLMRVSALLFAGGMIGAGLAREAWLIGLFIFLPIAAGTVGISSLPGMIMAARWFQAKRARAISIVAMGTSLGGMLIFPLIAFLVGVHGWRTALMMTGAVVGTVVFLISFLVRPSPGSVEPVEQSPAEPAAGALHPLVILRTPAFWAIAVSVSLMMAVDQTLLATVTPYMLDRGMTLAQTAAVMSATTAAAIAGKLLIAWIGDRADLRILLALTALCAFALCASLLTEPSYWTIFIVSMFTGAAIGVTYPLSAALMARQFGAASIGTALGLQAPLTSLSASAALYFIGATHDRTGSYAFAFAVFCGVLVLATAIIPLIPRRSESSAPAQDALQTA